MQNSILEQAKVDHEIRQNLVLNSKEKVKPVFLISLMCIFPESNETKFYLTTDTFKIQVFCRPEWTKLKGGPHENEFWQFSNTKMNITDS